MKNAKQCPDCGSREIYAAKVSAKGGYGPDLLPGVHSWWKTGNLHAYVCGSCGLYRLYVPDEDLPEVKNSNKFNPV